MTTPPNSIIKLIHTTDSFLCHVHLGPDPDSIGSALALKIALESIGKTVQVFCEDTIPHGMTFIPWADSIETISLQTALSYPYRCYLSLDTANWNLVSRSTTPKLDKNHLINIDHHPDSKIRSNFSWVDPNYSSTCEMIARLLPNLDIHLSSDIATCLLSGIISDTSTFANTNTTATTLQISARLIKSGANYNFCQTQLEKNFTQKDYLAWGVCLQSLKLSPSGDYAWMKFTYPDYLKIGLSPGTGIIANKFAGKIQNTKFGAIMVEKDPEYIKVSLRSRDPSVDVSQVAHIFGGGGHAASASFLFRGSMHHLEDRFVACIEQLKRQNKL